MSVDYKLLYRWLPWVSALLLAVVFLLFMYTDLQVHQRVWEERLEWNSQSQSDFLDASGRDRTQQAMLLAQLIARDKVVMDTVRAAHAIFIAKGSAGDIDKMQTARQALQRQLDDYWRDMAGLGARQLSVYFAPGAVSFLRMHRPDRYGDSVSGVRPLLANAFASGVPTSGVDVARQGSGYRAVVPIMANPDQSGGVIAVLEVGMSLLPQAVVNQSGSLQMAIFIRKGAVEQVLWEQARQALNQRNPTTVDDWRLENTTDPQLHDWWTRGIVPIKQRGQLLQSHGKTYVTSWLSLQSSGVAPDHAGLAALVWSDITAAYDTYVSTSRHIIAKWFSALVCAQLLLIGFARLNGAYLHSLIRQHSVQMHKEHSLSEQSQQRLALALRSSDSGFWEWDIARIRPAFHPSGARCAA